MKENYCVYMHTFPNGMKYVGITSQGGDPNKRWKDGFGYAKNHGMFAAIVKYGWDNITHEILRSGVSRREAVEMESKLIKELGLACFGYNKRNADSRRIMCVETQEVFDSISAAQRSAGVKSNSGFWKAIGYPNRTSGGKHWVFL